MSAGLTYRRQPDRNPFVALRSWVNHLAGSYPSRFAIVVFAALIMVFTVLFSLPAASANGRVTALPDALFTAVSVICVTGLSTVDMATHWSVFGNILVFVGVQIGAVGVLTLASILGMVISRRLGLRQRLMAASDTNPMRIHSGPVSEGQAVGLGEIGGLLRTVALSALVIEAVIAAIMIPRLLETGMEFGEAVWDGFYYSAMSFTNTGFSPNAEGMAPFADDYVFLSAMMLGVFLGSIGFPVIYVLSRNLRHPRRWSIHVKLTLLTSGILIALGTIAYATLENYNARTFGSMNGFDTVFQALFLSVMTRSGGFATIPIDQLNGSSLLVTDMLMFIGGGSASTAGGIKVTTLAVLFLAAVAEARGRTSMEAFGRKIPSDVLRLAVSVVLWGATTVAVSTITIAQISKAPLDFVLFDVISAFATSGLSTGLTASLPDTGVYVMAATMFLGRVGTVTLAAALAVSTSRQLFTRPEERPIVG